MPPDASRLRSVLQTCEHPLCRLADYRLDPVLDQRLRDPGERKEGLRTAEHGELLALVAFTQQRTLEKLEAEAALQDLQTALPVAQAGGAEAPKAPRAATTPSPEGLG